MTEWVSADIESNVPGYRRQMITKSIDTLLQYIQFYTVYSQFCPLSHHVACLLRCLFTNNPPFHVLSFALLPQGVTGVTVNSITCKYD